MKKGFLFKSVRVLIVLALAIFIAALLVTLRPRAERKERVETGRLVEVFAAQAEDFNMVIEAYGTIQPREMLTLVAEVHGQIVGLGPDFQEGDFFESGSTLIEIDPRTYTLTVQQRQVEISRAQAELAKFEQEVANLKATRKIAVADQRLAESEFTRLKTLSANNVIAKSTRDAAEQKFLASVDRLQGIDNQIALTGSLRKQLQAQLKMAQVQLQQSQLDLEKTRIKAPFDGWVLEKLVEKGQHVVIGQVLGRVYKDGDLDVEVRIPADDFKWLPNEPAVKDRLRVEIALAQEQDDEPTWTGRVARIKAQMDERTRTLPVIIEIDRDQPPNLTVRRDGLATKGLRPGMFVAVRIIGRQYKNAFVLSRHAVHAGDVVYAVADGQLKIKPVKVLRRFKDLVYIADGLQSGDLVVKSPLSAAVDGMAVRIKK
jgi:RND family efflux transporter MFP subunit